MMSRRFLAAVLLLASLTTPATASDETCLADINALIEARRHETMADVAAEIATIAAKKKAMADPVASILIQAAAKRALAQTTREAGRAKAHDGDYDAGRAAEAAYATLMSEAAAMEENIKAAPADAGAAKLKLKHEIEELERALGEAPALEQRRLAEVQRLKEAVRGHVERSEYDQAEALALRISAHEDVAEAFGKLAVVAALFAAEGAANWKPEKKKTTRTQNPRDWKPECAKEVVIPYGVTAIGDRAFFKCSLLTSFVGSDSVKTIGDGAFAQCTSLTSFVVSDSVTAIGDYAFYGCTSLTTASIPSGATLGGSVFDESPTTVTTRD